LIIIKIYIFYGRISVAPQNIEGWRGGDKDPCDEATDLLNHITKLLCHNNYEL
jgi:hypothetical protein